MAGNADPTSMLVSAALDPRHALPLHRELERTRIGAALRAADGVVAQAARLLGCPRESLRNWLRLDPYLGQLAQSARGKKRQAATKNRP